MAALHLILLSIYFVTSGTFGYESGSSELNRLEFAPYYDTIIFSDIADIVKEFGSNVNSPLDALTNSDDSESDENIEDLLSEYQHYLDKAQKKRKSYIEKSKSKNKIPLMQHDRYTKSKSNSARHNDLFYPSDASSFFNRGSFQYPQSQFKNPLDFLIPLNMKSGFFVEPQSDIIGTSNVVPEKSSSFDTIITNTKTILPLAVLPADRREPISSSCYCKNDVLPCECDCKQCFIPLDPMQRKNTKSLLNDVDKLPSFDNSSNDSTTINDNILNIRIKVDVQFPKILKSLGEAKKNMTRDKNPERGSSISRESNINLPFPHFNFPIPLELFGFKKYNQDSTPIHKITIHRKKKSKLNNNGKRHRKKMITFHNINLEPQHTLSTRPYFADNYNITVDHQRVEKNYQLNKTINLLTKGEPIHKNIASNKTNEPTVVSGNQTEESIYLMVNIRNNKDNVTEDARKLENSIETDYTKSITNLSTEEPVLRQKRDISVKNVKYAEVEKSETEKKTDKAIFDDPDLLYWPIHSKVSSVKQSDSITKLIIDRENKKAKLNVTKETIRNDRTQALEQAIFGKVDWDDVDTVAPVFMSFMGKYIKGVLTLCSQTVCHSMNCAEKMCLHRTCTPIERYNHKGHCIGSNKTESVASLEAIMDLPSNVASEIVDILQDKLLGKLYGKVTLCINAKCVTFVASKKIFMKTKCSTKDLSTTGHCPHMKSLKNM